MLTENTRQDILALVRRQVVPAIGCTEPICAALATARATERLGTLPTRICARLSANILKNAMGVGIPGTGMVGLPIAIALGAIVGKSAYGLEVLRDATPADVERGKNYIDEGRIDITLADDVEEKLYVDIIATDAEGHTAQATIAHEHTRFVDCDSHAAAQALADQSDLTTHDSDAGSGGGDAEQDLPHNGIGRQLNMQLVYDFATTAPLEEIEFINEAGRVNMEASSLSLRGNYGHRLGKALTRPMGRGIMGDNIFSHILSATSSACDARMAGAMIPVMSNSGSGNQGICATNPVMVFARENHNTPEELTRALMLSHLTAIYIKQHLGSLSALCGCIGQCLRHHLSDGRRLRADLCCRQKHDCQPHGHDLRWGKTFLRPQTHLGRIDRRSLGHARHAGRMRLIGRRHHRRLRRPQHPQPRRHRQECHERDRQKGT